MLRKVLAWQLKGWQFHSSTLMFVDHVQCLFFYKSGILFFFFARCFVQLGQRLSNLVGLWRSTGTFQALDATGGFVCCFSVIKLRSDSFQPTVRWKISPRSPMTSFCHQALVWEIELLHLLAKNNGGTLAYPQNIIFTHKTNYVTVQTVWKSPRQYAWSCLW